jgi:hypothetical protein
MHVVTLQVCGAGILAKPNEVQQANWLADFIYYLVQGLAGDLLPARLVWPGPSTLHQFELMVMARYLEEPDMGLVYPEWLGHADVEGMSSPALAPRG